MISEKQIHFKENNYQYHFR